MTASPISLPKEEVRHLRELARKMKKISSLPVMEERKKIWTAIKY